MSEQAGFKIGDQVYAFPGRFRMGDAVLVEEVTGLAFSEFAERIDAQNAAIVEAAESGRALEQGDVVVLTGLIAAAVWQANPRWKRDRVVAFVQELDFEQFETVGGDAAIPPGLGADSPESHSDDSSNGSTTTPARSSTEALV